MFDRTELGRRHDGSNVVVLLGTEAARKAKANKAKEVEATGAASQATIDWHDGQHTLSRRPAPREINRSLSLVPALGGLMDRDPKGTSRAKLGLAPNLNSSRFRINAHRADHPANGPKQGR